jgi:hypothetical protein
MDTATYNIIKAFYDDDTKPNKRQLIYHYFRDNMIVANVRANGEVHSPPCLVDDMLSTLGDHFFIANNKVYDPCCGKSAFQLALIDKYYKSMTCLEPIERITLIINDILFINDLNHLNVETTIQIMELHCKYLVPKLDVSTLKFNFTIGDALTQEHTRNYELVVANPPYNSRNCSGNGGGIYCDFIKKALELTKKNGHILFVNPSAWRKPLLPRSRVHGVFGLMTKENQMVFLSMNSNKEGGKMFGCDIKYDYYLIKKTPCYTYTKIIDYEKKIVNLDLSKHSFIPNFALDDIMILMAKDDKPRLKMMRGMSVYDPKKTHMSPVQTDDFKYKCLHTTPQKGNRFYYSNIDKGMFGVPKVIFGRCGLYDAIVDYNGEYGLTNNAYGIIIKSQEEGEMIKSALLSDKFKRILKANLYENFGINYTIFTLYRDDFYIGFI